MQEGEGKGKGKRCKKGFKEKGKQNYKIIEIV